MTDHAQAAVPDRAGSSQMRDRAVARVLWGVLVLNVAVTVSKMVVGAQIGALSLIADSIHSLLDASSNVVGLVGIAVASRPPDENHPYGHRRFETVAALFVGLLIAGGMVEVGSGLLDALQGKRAAPHATIPAALVVAGTVFANLVISRYERKRGVELRSSILLADSSHTMTDAMGAVVVLVSFLGVALGLWWADLVGAFVVALLIGRTAFHVLRVNLGVLTDTAHLDAHQVRASALRVSGVHGAHRIRSRGPAGHVSVDLHIHLDPKMTVERAHALTHAVADRIRRDFPDVVDVVIHTEPADGRQHDLDSIHP